MAVTPRSPLYYATETVTSAGGLPPRDRSSVVMCGASLVEVDE
jgi:hypothetical protein